MGTPGPLQKGRPVVHQKRWSHELLPHLMAQVRGWPQKNSWQEKEKKHVKKPGSLFDYHCSCGILWLVFGFYCCWLLLLLLLLLLLFFFFFFFFFLLLLLLLLFLLLHSWVLAWLVVHYCWFGLIHYFHKTYCSHTVVQFDNGFIDESMNLIIVDQTWTLVSSN